MTAVDYSAFVPTPFALLETVPPALAHAVQFVPVATIPITERHRVGLHRMTITPAVAQDWLLNYHYPRQRPTYPSLVRGYATAMRNRDWQVSTIMLCAYSGPPTLDLEPGTYLINGRNRLSAVVESGEEQPFLIEHHVTTDAEDVHRLYQVQDRGRTRSVADVFRSIGLDQELGVSVSDLRWLSEAEAFFVNRFTRRRGWLTDPFARADFIRDWLDEGIVWRTCVGHARSKVRVLFTAAPITAVAMYTLRHQRARAEPFWRDVCADDGLVQGQPAKTLHDWVVDNRVETAQRSRYDHCRYVAQAWNSFFIGNEIDRIVVRDFDLPVNILGTPMEIKRLQRHKGARAASKEEPSDGTVQEQ